MVKRSVPASQWCGGNHSGDELVAPAPRRGWKFWKKQG
jgi:hypothetical protein